MTGLSALFLLAGFKCGFLAAVVLPRLWQGLGAALAAGTLVLLLLGAGSGGRWPAPDEWAIAAGGLLAGVALGAWMRHGRAPAG